MRREVGGHQTCQYRRQVPAIGANSIRGRLGHYRTGFRRPSQDRKTQALTSCLKKTNSTTEAERKPGKAKNPQAGKMIGWGSFLGATNHGAPRGARAQTAT